MVRRLSFLMLAVVVMLALTASVAAARSASPSQASVKVIVLLKRGGSGKEVAARLAARDARAVYRYHIIPAFSATVTPATLSALRADPNVLSVVNDRRIRVPKTPASGSEELTAATRTAGAAAAGDAPMESEALQLTHAQDAWSITVKGQNVTGQGVRVGMLDTGTDPYHPDLAGAVGGYKDFTGEGLYDDIGHGTAASSTVAAQGLPVFNSETGTTMQLSGMAPGAKVFMAKVAGSYDGWDSQTIRGIEWLLDRDVDIISCSLGWLFLPQDGKDPGALAMQAAVDQGVTVVNSEGNEGPGQGTTPDAPGVIAVGATTGNREFSQIGFLVDGDAYKGDQVITWSSRGPNSDGVFRPDIMGFGAYSWALAPSLGSDMGMAMTEFGGTSMAAPVVAGDLALAQCAWKLAHPGKRLPKPAYWKKLLASTATDLGYPALDQSTGLVNAEAAIKAVLRRGKSMLVTVAADGRTPCSWSPRVAAGTRKSTTITVKNTGSAKETISLTPTVFKADADETITKTVALVGPDYVDYEDVTVPSGTDLVQTTVTWPSGPEVSVRTAVYDSDGAFITYAPTYGGYGHLSQCQVSLKGPKDQRPVVKAGSPWTLAIFPRASMSPSATQVVNIRIEFLHKADWGQVRLSKKRVTLAGGHSRSVKATVAMPGDSSAGTYFGGIRVSNGTTVTTVPLSVRVPVTLIEGRFGTFQGKLTGSTVEYFGGEFYFYDVTVPKGAESISAQVTWPNQGNLVNVYLVDPSGRVRDAKGGDLRTSDYSGPPWVPAAALTRTAEQVVWADPAPGRWQIILWAPGFNGYGFSEPYRGVVTVTGGSVEPAEWTATAAPGATATMDFTVTNDGPTELAVYASSTASSNGTALFEPVWEPDYLNGDPPRSGSLPGEGPSGSSVVTFSLPQNVQQVTAIVNWDDPGTLLDLGLYDPTGTDVAEAIASTSEGNAVQVQEPMAGDWTVTIAYADPALPPTPVDWGLYVMYVAPVPVDGFSGPDADAPVTVAAEGSATISASITVPADAAPGDVVTGTVDFYTAADGQAAAGGDHLGSVPVTINVAGQ
jgi:hypothetical protein